MPIKEWIGMDKAAKRLAVIYVILLSLCAPLMAVHFELFTWFMGVVDMSYWTQTVLWFLPMLVYGGILVILGIWNMVKSFQIYKRQGHAWLYQRNADP